MDRLDFQTTRRFNGTGKKRAGFPEHLKAQLVGIHSEPRQCIAQGLVRHHRPFTETAEQTVLHLGGGGLGIGQA